MRSDQYRVDPMAARATVDRAADAVDQLGQLEVDLVQALELASGAVLADSRTAAAIAAIQTDPFEIDLLAAQQQATAAIEATRNAIGAYEHGDVAMAQQYERRIDQ